MRTSPAQFEVMVEFMERNGDLNRPTAGPHGRLTSLTKWDELANVLNMDVSGSSRPVDKWRKVWSDFKNNTKKKAAKIHRAATGTGGGPASRLALTDLEQRVLGIMGAQSATGLPGVAEVGLDQVPVPQIADHDYEESELPSVFLRSPTPPTSQDVQQELLIEDVAESRPEEMAISTPFQASAAPVELASPSRNSSRARRRFTSPRGETRRRFTMRRPQRREDLVESLVSADSQWRTLAAEFVTENARLRARELELREREIAQRDRDLQSQAQWQILFARCLDIVERHFTQN